MKIGDKVVFRKLIDKERIGRIIGISKDGKSVAVKTRHSAFVVHPAFEDIVVIKEEE